MRHFQFLILLGLLTNAALAKASERQFQTLHIPESITGTTFNLDLHPSNKVFWKGSKGTPTFGYNKEKFWGPTLIFNKGDKVTLNMKNSLSEPTTTHWHGLHIPAEMDGGPHQLVTSGKTWSPTFEVMNNAGTFWYHPHAHSTTQNQLTSGAGGLIIIRDKSEAKLNLPRTYGIDDIPLVLTSRRFTLDDRFTFNGDNDKYGDYELVNGVMDPETTLPAQWVRLRILNAEVERGYILGFSDNRTYYQIATDGGLVDKPVPLKRMTLMVGERAEILVNLGGEKPGSTVDLMAFNSNQPFGFPGGEAGTTPPNGGYLNNLDFRILHIRVGDKTLNAVDTIPTVMTRNSFPRLTEVTKERNLTITANNPGEPFGFNEKLFEMERIDQVIQLGAVEKWTITNNRIFGHSFHIHDVQFKIVSRSNGPVEEFEVGWKDSVYVPRGQSVSFIAKFDDFASDQHSFMYHCHMANHEDGGLMGQFLVVKDSKNAELRYHQGIEHPLTTTILDAANKSIGTSAPIFSGLDLNKNPLKLESMVATKPALLYFIDANCPCAKEASPFINRLQKQLGNACHVVGVINSKAKVARKWAKTVGSTFPILTDSSQKIISAYKAKNAVTVILIAPGGRIVSYYPGYNQEMLLDISKRISVMTGTKFSEVDFADAPMTLTIGCPF